jgi:putative spermidine/putrescine transport system substrate-binding protein
MKRITSQNPSVPVGIVRRSMLAGAVAIAANAVLVTGPALAQAVTINVIDVAGNLALSQPIFDNYRAANPDKVSRFTFSKAPAPELAGKIKAMQNAGRVDIDLVLSGSYGLSAGIEQDLWLDLSKHADKVGDPTKLYEGGALGLQKLAQGRGMLMAYSPQGPFLQYAPERVKNVPKSADELLAWCKANPNKLIYARPANSGPGATFLMGLPYILGDKDPKEPINGWEKTWAFLKELDSCIEYYPSGTAATMKEFGNGTRDIVVSTMGWDINPRFLGTVPRSSEVTALANHRFVNDGQFMIVPKGLSERKLEVVLDFIAFALRPEQQAIIYDSGYLYPGPAVKGVTLAMAPKESQEVIKQFGRPYYDELMAKTPVEVLLEPKVMVEAFRKWDIEVGGKKTN